MLAYVKQALRISDEDYDEVLGTLIDAALGDLGLAGIETHTAASDPNIKVPVSLYCRLHFGSIEPDEWDRVNKAYNEKKAQLQMSARYSSYDADRGGE